MSGAGNLGERKLFSPKGQQITPPRAKMPPARGPASGPPAARPYSRGTRNCKPSEGTNVNPLSEVLAPLSSA